MRNVTGQVALGDSFFDRKADIARFWRGLQRREEIQQLFHVALGSPEVRIIAQTIFEELR